MSAAPAWLSGATRAELGFLWRAKPSTPPVERGSAALAKMLLPGHAANPLDGRSPPQNNQPNASTAEFEPYLVKRLSESVFNKSR